MPSERRYLWIAIAAVAAVALAVLLVPRVREELAPEPERAWVAVAARSSRVARVGRTEIESGVPFRLFAVLEASDRNGEPLYYTEAEALEIDGVEIPAQRLRRWDRPGRVVVLWFTIEGYRPFVEIETSDELESFRFEEVFRPEWGRGWTVAGSVTPRNQSLARGLEPGEELPFGTARYHVRIERYLGPDDPTPAARYRSPTGLDLSAGGPLPTSVVMSLGSALARPSAVFGLPQIEPGEAAPRVLLGRLGEWYRGELAFSRLLVLSRALADLGLAWSELTWAPIELARQPSFEPAGPGDLLRAGERIVVIYRDRGEPGRLDYDDLCFDFAESAAVRRLGDVFGGGGIVEWADLSVAAEGGD